MNLVKALNEKIDDLLSSTKNKSNLINKYI